MLAAGLWFACLPVCAGVYDQPALRGAQWLAGHGNPDGSWGATVDVRPLCTAEAVRALSAAYQRQGPYYAGLAWLEGHAGGNVDSAARRIGGLAAHGDGLDFSLAYLQSAQSRDGAAYSGWGLSSLYASSALDTALALLAHAGLGSSTQVQPALDYLKTTQHSGVNDKGWPVGSAGGSDAFATALVVQALARFKAWDTSLASRINDALATLTTLVDPNAAPYLQALAAQAALDAGDSTASAVFLGRLAAIQAMDGGFGGDVYASALATRALATAAGLAGQGVAVDIPDQALRRAVNAALGRNAMDGLNRGELARLTSLSAAGLGIADLTGLEWASKLASADLRNNQITSQAPLAGLTLLTNLQLAGNPVAGSTGSIAVPALPAFGQVLMGAALLALSAYLRKPSHKG